MDSCADWLDRPAMMRIPVSSPAVLGRLKALCKPYDFVLAPVVREQDLLLEKGAEKPILVTRFNKYSEEWSAATYYNVCTGDPYSVTTGESDSETVIPVRSYRSIVNAYVNNAESKFNGPDGTNGAPGLAAYSKEMHVVARQHRYCGKELKRKLEQGPVDHDAEFKCKVYENGGVAEDPETLQQLARFSERQIGAGTGLRRDSIRLIRHGKTVKRATYEKAISFLGETTRSEVRRASRSATADSLLAKRPKRINFF